jgi:hypothetical protein
VRIGATAFTDVPVDGQPVALLPLKTTLVVATTSHIQEMDLSGGPPRPRADFGATALAFGAPASLYASTNAGLQWIDLSEGTPKPVPDSPAPALLASVSGGKAYAVGQLATAPDGQHSLVSLEGAGASPLGPGLKPVSAIAADSDHVYLAYGGKLMRYGLADGEVSEIAPVDGEASHVFVDDECVYWWAGKSTVSLFIRPKAQRVQP